MEVNFESYKIKLKNLSDIYSVKYCARDIGRHKYVTFCLREKDVSTKNSWRPLRKELGEKEQDGVCRTNRWNRDSGIHKRKVYVGSGRYRKQPKTLIREVNQCMLC